MNNSLSFGVSGIRSQALWADAVAGDSPQLIKFLNWKAEACAPATVSTHTAFECAAAELTSHQPWQVFELPYAYYLTRSLGYYDLTAVGPFLFFW